MRKILAYLLLASVLFTALPGLADTLSDRQNSIVIYDTPIEEDEFNGYGTGEIIKNESSPTAEEQEDGENGDGIVYNPDEEIVLDGDMLTESFNQLDGMRNILLLGVDSRTGEIQGRTDTMILLTVDIEGQVIKLTSFLRDLYVEIPGYKNNRLNAAFVFGGYDLLAKTFEKNFGIRPDAYVAVNLSGLAQIIDKLGGVYVDVDSKKIDRINAVIYWYNKQVLGLNNLRDGYLTKGGRQLLTGKQAEAWARYRYSESDYKRAERQRQLISIIFDEIKNMSLSELIAFAMENANLIKTNLTIQEILSLAPAVLAMKDAEIREFRLPIDGGAKSEKVSGMSVLVPDRRKNANALHEFLAND